MSLLTLEKIVADVNLPNGMYFRIDAPQDVYDPITVCVCKDDDVCNVTKKPNYGWRGRDWIIRHSDDESHVLRTLWACFMATMEHELREQFVYKGKLPFGPHFDIGDVMAKADEVAPLASAVQA